MTGSGRTPAGDRLADPPQGLAERALLLEQVEAEVRTALDTLDGR